MRVLVTGGAGFIGSHFADRLLDEGHEVLIIDNLSTGSRQNIPESVRLVELDLLSPLAAVAIDAFKPEAIFHFAAQINIQTSLSRPVYDAEQNILSTLALLELAKSHRSYFVFASSGGAIYGEAECGPQDEHHPEYPLNPYGVAKLAVDRYLHSYHHQFGLQYCSMRFSNVYGPRQGGDGEAGVVSIFMNRLRHGQKMVIFGDGLQERDLVFVKDLASASSAILARRPIGVFNFCTGVATSILELAKITQSLFAQTDRIEFAPARAGEQRRSLLSPNLAHSVLGWRAETSIESGLRQAKAWCLNEPEP
jgi:UDP-glucose 4-epimerase